MGSTEIEQAHYLRRMLDKKLSKMDPKLSFHERMRKAMEMMDEEFGEGWRGVEGQGDPDSPVAETPLSSDATDKLFSNLHRAADEEGLPTPPESLRKYGEEVEAKEPTAPSVSQQPLVIIINNRIKANGKSSKQPISGR